ELQAHKHQDAARKIFVHCLAHAPQVHQRERALYQLSTPLAAGSLEFLISGLSDSGERVRKLALLRLEEARAPDVLPVLMNAYKAPNSGARPAPLRLIHDRDPAAGKSLLPEAAESAQPELKLTALDLQGKLDDPALEPQCLKLAREGNELIKPIAVKGLLL